MRKWLKWGVPALVLAVLVAGYLRPTLTGDREDAKRVCCAANLKTIGLALKMYAADNAGFLPPDLYLLVANRYAEQPKLYLCPEVARDSPREFPTRASFHTDYYYAYTEGATWGGPDAVTRVLITDCAGNHRNYGNALFADGRVKGFAGPEWYRTAGLDRVPERAK